MCARFARGSPPTEAKLPPMYQPPAPSETEAPTQPGTSGQSAWRLPESSNDTKAPLSGPMYLKSPATKAFDPETATALTSAVSPAGGTGVSGPLTTHVEAGRVSGLAATAAPPASSASNVSTT